MKKTFTDLEIKYDESKGHFDLVIENGDLKADTSFDTGINLALMTDGRADNSEVRKPEEQRGTIVDLFTPFRNGSKLWLLEQARNDRGALNRAIDYCKNALSYFVDMKFVKNIQVSGKQTIDGIRLNVVIYGISGSIDRWQYDAWNNSVYKV